VSDEKNALVLLTTRHYSDRRRRSRRRRSRSRRKREPSSDDDTPDDSDDGDGLSGGSSSEYDGLGPTVRGHRKFRIKQQKFDGTGSWESWWAHFQNCATHNRWTERDKLAFLKGALTGGAARVLWDTDRSTTNSLKKYWPSLKVITVENDKPRNTVLNCKHVDVRLVKAYQTSTKTLED